MLSAKSVVVGTLFFLGSLGTSNSKRLGNDGIHHRKLSPSYCDNTYDVIIVGAGMAGLSAAATLKAAGKKVVVLEIRHEVGGRMRTTNLTDVAGFKEKDGKFHGFVDEGASWINGGRGAGVGRPQPIKVWADESETDYYEHSFDDIDAYDGADQVTFNKLNQKLRKLGKAYKCLDDFGNDLYEDFYDRGTNTVIDQDAESVLAGCGWEPKVGDVLEVALDSYYFNNEYLLDTKDISGFNFPEDVYFDFGNADYFIKDKAGAQGIAQYYLEDVAKLEEDVDIFYETEVTLINYSDPGADVSVTTDSCDLYGNRLIYTPSIGVIEATKNSVFFPVLDTSSLPLVMGTWTKIFFQFDERFWEDDKQWIILGTSTKNTCSVWLNYDFQGSPKKFNKLFPGSNILACLMDQPTVDRFGGIENYVIDATTDAEDLLGDLKTAYNRPNLPSYKVYATNWLEDPCAMGSWENWKFDNPAKDLDDYYDFFLLKNDRLLLSGSASCIRFFGFMTGAYFGGIKSANWALNLMNGNKTMPYSPCDDEGNLQNIDYQGGPGQGNRGNNGKQKGKKQQP